MQNLDPELVTRYENVAREAVVHAMRDGITDETVLSELAREAVLSQYQRDIDFLTNELEKEVGSMESSAAQMGETLQKSKEEGELQAAQAALAAA